MLTSGQVEERLSNGTREKAQDRAPSMGKPQAKLGEQSAEEPITSARSSPGQLRESRPLEVAEGLAGTSRWRDVGTGSFHSVWREII